MTSEELSEYREAGFNAAAEGVPVNENPNEQGTGAYEAWAEGHADFFTTTGTAELSTQASDGAGDAPSGDAESGGEPEAGNNETAAGNTGESADTVGGEATVDGDQPKDDEEKPAEDALPPDQ